MRSKIRYTNQPIGNVEIVADFLLSPAQLALFDKGVKIKVALSKKRVDYFKSEASKHHTQ